MEISTRKDVEKWLERRYFLSNYRPNRITLFMPEPYGGSCAYIYGALAEELGAIYDSWNFRVWSERLKNPQAQFQSVQTEITQFLDERLSSAI